MKTNLILISSLILMGSLFLSCSKDKDKEADKIIELENMEGAGTWNNPYKIPVGSTKTSIKSGAYLFEFPYSIGQTYTIKLSKFTKDVDLAVAIGYGPKLGTNLTNSTNQGLVEEQLTYKFSQEDLYLHIENLEDDATEVTITITKE